MSALASKWYRSGYFPGAHFLVWLSVEGMKPLVSSVSTVVAAASAIIFALLILDIIGIFATCDAGICSLLAAVGSKEGFPVLV